MQDAHDMKIATPVLQLYEFSIVQVFLRRRKENRAKFIFRVDLQDGRRLVIKIINEEDDCALGCAKRSSRVCFPNFCVPTACARPGVIRRMGRFCHKFAYDSLPCCVTVEDWCGVEICQIDAETARRIGELMARMHPSFAGKRPAHRLRHAVFGRLLERRGRLFQFWRSVRGRAAGSGHCRADMQAA